MLIADERVGVQVKTVREHVPYLSASEVMDDSRTGAISSVRTFSFTCMLQITTAAEFVLYGVLTLVLLVLVVIAICCIKRFKANARLLTSGLIYSLLTVEIERVSNFLDINCF